MITLSIYRGDVVGSNGKLYPICNMKIYDKINLILGGDSGSGKTYLFKSLQSYKKHNKSTY